MFSPAALSASASNPPGSMASQYAGCSIVPAQARPCQYRPRLAVSISPLARQLACPQDRGDQDGSVRSSLAPVRRTADWNDPTSIPRSGILLERHGSGAQAGRIRGLLQRAIASTDRSMERRPRNAQAHLHLLLPRLTVTLDGSIATLFSRLQLPLDWEFTTHRTKLVVEILRF